MKRALTIILSAAVLAACVAAADYWNTFHRCNVVEGACDSLYVKIYHDYTLDDICRAVARSGALRDSATFARAARHLKLGEGFKSGFYRYSATMNNKAIVRMIANGWQKPINVSFSGYIRTLEKFAKILSERFEADSASFVKVLTDSTVMARYGFEKESFLGMFIPNTYEFYWTVRPEDFVERMSREYSAFWNDERKAKAKAAGLSQKEVSTLAAIVIEETKYEPEMPRIAGVYINRLNKGILLQADPTVKYALNMKGITRILNKHLKVDSPYNTYVHKGLPPGPITMPPIVALDAVLNYEKHNYIFFCAKETFNGQHNFAVTLSQHMANARAYHKALNIREREKSRSKNGQHS